MLDQNKLSIISQTEIEYWQPRLNLLCFDISVKIKNDLIDCYGRVDTDVQEKIAIIEIANDLTLEQLKDTIRHEMLHIFIDYCVESCTETSFCKTDYSEGFVKILEKVIK